MVHERHSDFERVGHREAVGQRQEIVSQVGLVVDVKRRRKVASSGAEGFETPEALARGVPTDRGPERRCVELCPQLVAGAELQIKVLVSRGTVTRSQEALQTVD